ncbi:putative oxidoreductase [Candidatus Promineifilum breve]|uniref:Oxidoreductase n=1 Tax=Candidatus Promineifilum breve TaxID=1806508 RepID=A0A160T2R3_9CHLR|nr:FAD-dependent oxidoreductase [Candidatus Promineifilum breve]CUS04004.2 putative oxidoreductase [Candidatus Promineifilum breve]
MLPTSADIVICGAGIAGISAAYHLAARHGIRDVLLIEEGAPLMLTSDKSTEAYRNWWPGPGDAMVRFMNRSIDLLEELADQSGNVFHLNRRGYVFLTADAATAERYQRSAEESERLGAGELRVHRGLPADPPFPPHISEGYAPHLGGADLVLDPALIQARLPFVTPEAIAMLHPRRCGWLSAQQLGMWLLEEAKRHGARLVNGRVTAIDTTGGRVNSVTVRAGEQEHTIQTRVFVNAAGPLVDKVGELLGVELPVFNELHGKVAINDPLGIVPRDAPLLIWSDPVTLPWADEERDELAAAEETRWLTEPFPAGVHFRPEGGPGATTLLLLWTYDVKQTPAVWPTRFEPEYAEVVVRGLGRMVPGLAAYAGNFGRPYVDGGYYCKTQENRPLIGPLPVAGAYIFGALSGYGIMASQAGADLLAGHIAGSALPGYAAAMALSRYDDPAYRALLDSWDPTTGQL